MTWATRPVCTFDQSIRTVGAGIEVGDYAESLTTHREGKQDKSAKRQNATQQKGTRRKGRHTTAPATHENHLYSKIPVRTLDLSASPYR
jgi:hypothetical protein